MKFFSLVFAAALLSGCASVGNQLASSASNAFLRSTVGQPYTQVVYERPHLGKLIGRERLSNGDEVMKHVGEFGNTSSDIGRIYGTEDQVARTTYFRVGADGLVKDWAAESFNSGKATCWVGICKGARNEQVSTEELDRIVKTSSGQSIETWRRTTN